MTTTSIFLGLFSTTGTGLFYVASFAYGFTHVNPKLLLSDPIGSLFFACLAGITSAFISSWTIWFVCPAEFLTIPAGILAGASIRNLLRGPEASPIMSFATWLKDQEDTRRSKLAARAECEKRSEANS